VTAQATLLLTVAVGVTVSLRDGVASMILMGVPVLNAKKKLAPPCTRQESGAKLLKVFAAYPGTFHRPYWDATICPSIFWARTADQPTNITKTTKILFIERTKEVGGVFFLSG